MRTPASPAAAGEGDHAKHGGRGALNDLRISIVRKAHPLQAPLPARTARHLPRPTGEANRAYPRKGTETYRRGVLCRPPPPGISKPHPRKGTERANLSLPCRSGGGGPCEAWWKGRLERSAHLHREKVTSAASAPTGSHRSPPPPFRRGRRIEHIPARGRKLGLHAVNVVVRDVAFQNHIPARGLNVRTPASPAAAGEWDHAKHG